MAAKYTKTPGDALTLSLKIWHSGKERTATVYMTLAEGGPTHGDPVVQPSNHRFRYDILVPAATTKTSTIYTLSMGGLPEDLIPGKQYDVNIAIGPKHTSGTFTDWYSKRQSDDWDDGVYATAEVKDVLEIDEDGTSAY